MNPRLKYQLSCIWHGWVKWPVRAISFFKVMAILFSFWVAYSEDGMFGLQEIWDKTDGWELLSWALLLLGSFAPV